MTLRLKVAKWLAPELAEEIDNRRKHIAWLERSLDNQSDLVTRFSHAHHRQSVALRNIAALRTPSCASIGKRMADIAETALREGDE